jgi:hypothetical protein
VSASEYTVGTMVGASTGVVDVVNFTRELDDFQGRPYVLEADYLLSGTRTGPAEISRILGLYGISVDGSFAAASDGRSRRWIPGGCALPRAHRQGNPRGSATRRARLPGAGLPLVPNRAGRREGVNAQFDSRLRSHRDRQLWRWRYPENRLDRLSAAFERREDFSGSLQRTTSGPSGEFAMRNPYMRDHVVADRLLSYWTKRLNTLRVAEATIYAAQLGNGDRISITDNVSWSGTKDFIATGIARPGDSNDARLREYVPDIYVYTAGHAAGRRDQRVHARLFIHAAVRAHGPHLVSQGTSADTDGKVTAYALVRAVPPATNWARLMVQLKDTTTGEIYQAQLTLNAGNYEATVSGLRPNRVHSILCWAVNANNIDGATATLANFTSANAAIGLSAPTVAVSQTQSFQVDIDQGAVTDVAAQPKFRRYVLFEKVGAGSFAEVMRSDQRIVSRNVNHGTAYQYKVHAEDVNGNETGDSNTVSITPVKRVDGGYITDASINQGRSYTGTGSASSSIGAGSSQSQIYDVYTFFPGFDKGGSAAGPVRLGCARLEGRTARRGRGSNSERRSEFQRHRERGLAEVQRMRFVRITYGRTSGRVVAVFEQDTPFTHGGYAIDPDEECDVVDLGVAEDQAWTDLDGKLCGPRCTSCSASRRGFTTASSVCTRARAPSMGSVRCRARAADLGDARRGGAAQSARSPGR